MPVDPLRTPHEVASALGSRVKALRLSRNWKRDTLASRAGVSPASLKLFEATGKVSLESFLKLCDALERLHEVDRLLLPATARSMAELEARAEKRPPRRGRL